MCTHPIRWSLVLLIVAVAGCHGSHFTSPIPSVDEVAKVHLTRGQFLGRPENKSKDFCEATFTERADISPVLDWLAAIDWSQEGMDLTPVTLPQPDGGITLTTKDGATLDFGYYWDGRIIHGRANRLYKVADMSGLRKITDKACK